jgi:hypothetical protein
MKRNSKLIPDTYEAAKGRGDYNTPKAPALEEYTFAFTPKAKCKTCKREVHPTEPDHKCPLCGKKVGKGKAMVLKVDPETVLPRGARKIEQAPVEDRIMSATIKSIDVSNYFALRGLSVLTLERLCKLHGVKAGEDWAVTDYTKALGRHAEKKSAACKACKQAKVMREKAKVHEEETAMATKKAAEARAKAIKAEKREAEKKAKREARKTEKAKAREVQLAKDYRVVQGEKVTKKSQPVESDGTKDAWGSREGTRSHAINAVLLSAKGPLTLAEVTKKAGNVNAVGNHLRTLVGKGLVEHTEKGYVRAKGK